MKERAVKKIMIEDLLEETEWKGNNKKKMSTKKKEEEDTRRRKRRRKLKWENGARSEKEIIMVHSSKPHIVYIYSKKAELL